MMGHNTKPNPSRVTIRPPAPFKLTAPEPLEQDIHEQCATALNRLLLPPAFWFCAGIGGVQLSPAQAARLARMGVKRGLPDLFILYNGLWLIELKRRGGRLSETRIVRTRRGSPRILAGQVDVFTDLCKTGAVSDIAVVYSVDEMLAQLAQWEIPMRARVSIPAPAMGVPA